MGYLLWEQTLELASYGGACKCPLLLNHLSRPSHLPVLAGFSQRDWISLTRQTGWPEFQACNVCASLVLRLQVWMLYPTLTQELSLWPHIFLSQALYRLSHLFFSAAPLGRRDSSILPPGDAGAAGGLETGGKCLHFYFDKLDAIVSIGKPEVTFGIQPLSFHLTSSIKSGIFLSNFYYPSANKVPSASLTPNRKRKAFPVVA